MNPERYDSMVYNRCGKTGLLLPAISLGCWHNFGAAGTSSNRITDEHAFHANCRQMLVTAFDLGITHFDLANNYGPPPGSAEERVGQLLGEFPRDELIISTKAGYRMWPGPYGEWGSRKYLLASLDQSLQRLGLDYVDIFYSHRFDPYTPVEETMDALDQAVRSGKAIYTGISSYNGDQTHEAWDVCKANGFKRPVIHQPSYSMFNRWIEDDLLEVVGDVGIGVIAFCPLAQGLLTDKYLNGVPDDSRAGSEHGFLKKQNIKQEEIEKARKLSVLAKERGQSLAQMVLAWTLRDSRVTSALIGASRPEQIVENVAALKNRNFSAEELKRIEGILGK